VTFVDHSEGTRNHAISAAIADIVLHVYRSNFGAVANAAFYYGPVWKEHKKTLNDLMTDSDNVMLLRPLGPERGVPILPAVDPVTEVKGAQGIVVAQIFALKANSVEAFAKAVETTFASYRAAGHAKPASWLRWM